MTASYQTTAEQRQQLLDEGYVLLPGAVPPALLAGWQELAEVLEQRALEAHRAGRSVHGACVSDVPVGPQLMRQDDVLGTAPDPALDLLACPAMLAVARELCGRGAVPLQMDILYKRQHPHPPVLWHQGAQHPRGHPYLNVGIYLDDAPAGDGCLRYVPGTQHEAQDIQQLSEDHGWEIPGVVEQPARAGDILVQDMMILHGSEPKRSPGVRRTIYVELRPVEGIAESAVQSARWLELRKRWMALVLRRAVPDDWPADWSEDLPEDLSSDSEEIEAILAAWESPIPSRYSPMPVTRPDYPVPGDLGRA